MKKLFKNHNQSTLLIGIVILAVVLRFFQLGTNPPSLNWDEVSWGYNAYALGIDGRDEFGVFLPYAYLESYGDFKPPLYAYLSIIPIKLFGLTEFATRFSSAFFGSLTVLLSYFLIRKIFFSSPYREQYGLLTAFLLAISPWHIMLSRAAFEANLVTFFLVLGVWLFLKGIREKSLYLILSVIPFALSLYAFNTARIVAPLLALLLFVSFFKLLITKKRTALIGAVVLGLVLVGPLVPFLLSEQASLRFKEVNIFSDSSVYIRANQEIANDGNAVWSKFLHHRYLAFGVEFISHYVDHFNPDFLFIKGDENPKFSTQDTGQLYLFEIPFFITGIILLFRRKEGYWWLVPFWILIGILPAATARETPHALRIESTLPMFQLMTAIGISGFYFWVKNTASRLVRPASIVLGGIIFLNVLYFLHGYYRHYPRENSGDWQYSYKASINYVSQVKDDYDEVQVTEELGRPYAFYLFYTATDPKQFRLQAKVDHDPFGFVHVRSFDKYTFHKNITPDKELGKNVLYVTTPDEVPDGAMILKEFPLINGRTQLVAFTL